MKKRIAAMGCLAMLFSLQLFCSQPGGAAEEKVVASSLADKAALYHARERWGGDVQIFDVKTYLDLTGQPAAYVYTIYKKAGAAPDASKLSSKVQSAKDQLGTAQAELDKATLELKPIDTYSVSRDSSEVPRVATPLDQSQLQRVEVTAPFDLSKMDLNQLRAERGLADDTEETPQEARLRIKEKVAQLRQDMFQTADFGTVVVGANFGNMPLLEMFDGLPLHYTMLDEAANQAREAFGGTDFQKGEYLYLGPTFFCYEYVKDGRRLLTDPTTRQSVDRLVLIEKPVRSEVDTTAAWDFIRYQVDAKGGLVGGAVPSGGATGLIGGVPFYHQDDYGAASCGPTASAQLLGYWDDHGYGNLVDHGWSNTGHEWQLIYDLMEAEEYDPAVGTYGNKILPGILAVANNSKYGNELGFTGDELCAYSEDTVSWSHITTEINAGRPFVMFNWDTSKYPNWAHFTTGVGYDDTGHKLYIHYNYPPNTHYLINWDSIPADNRAIYRIYPHNSFQTVFSEDFEGTFPGWWNAHSNSAGKPYWGLTSYKCQSGSNPAPNCPPPAGNTGWSVYCAKSGTGAVNPPGPYPNSMDSWMIWGPFSLKRTSGSAEVDFYYWLNSESGNDHFQWMSSTDGIHFGGFQTSGNAGGWHRVQYDISARTGDHSVWVAFRFVSNSSVTAEGAYVDTVTIRKSQDSAWIEKTKINNGDYNQDMHADLGIFRPTSGHWYVKKTDGSSTLVNAYKYGNPGDIPVMGDYDGDGEMDIAVFRRSTGYWYAKTKTGGSISGFPVKYGNPGDIPVPGDYDGDGRTDIAIFRPSTGQWFAQSNGYGSFQTISGFPYTYGTSTDIPVPGRYSLTGKTDIAVFRPASGEWFCKYRSGGSWSTCPNFPKSYGSSWDIPVPGDYDGDDVEDLAVYRPSTGSWYAWSNWGLYTIFSGVSWGNSTDKPVPLDYDGDGVTELAVWRPASGQWYVEKPDGAVIVNGYSYGSSADWPLTYNSGVFYTKIYP